VFIAASNERGDLTYWAVNLITNLMAQRTIVELLHDIDGKPADETIHFGLDGSSYQVDLSKKNAEALRKLLGPYVENARKISGGRGRKAVAKVSKEIDTKAVRAWAASHGIELSTRGRIPGDVLAQYRAAGN
jgi:hypothetical protein